MMNCPKCGMETPDDGKFCVHCGVPLAGNEAPAPGAAAFAAAAPAATATTSGSGEITLWEGRPSLKPAIPSILLLIVIAAIVYALAFFSLRFLEERGQAAPPNFWNIFVPAVAGVALLIILIRLIRQWFRKMTIRYVVSTQRILIEHGMVSKRNDELELEHYKDIIVHRGILDSVVGCGDIRIVTSDNTHPVVELHDISSPLETKEIIRTSAEARKRALGIIRREEL